MITSTWRNTHSARRRFVALHGAALSAASAPVVGLELPRRGFHDGSCERGRLCAIAVAVLGLHGLLALEALRLLDSKPAAGEPAELHVQLNVFAPSQPPRLAAPAAQLRRAAAPPVRSPLPAAAPPRVHRATPSSVARPAVSPAATPSAQAREAQGNAARRSPEPDVIPAAREQDATGGPAAPRTPSAPGDSPVASGEPTSAPIFSAAYLRNPPPDYPAIAQQRAWTGTVVLKVHVLASGKPDQIEIVSSSGHAPLDDAAKDAVTGWRFVPARRAAQAVDAWVQVPIEFKLGT